MTLQAHFFIRSALEIARFPASRMRSDLAAAVALYADVPFRMARLAGLKISARLRGMFSEHSGVLLPVHTQHHMRLDPQRALGEAAVAVIAVFCFMAAIARLRIVLGLDRMHTDEVAAVALRLIVAAIVALARRCTIAPTLVTVKAPVLLMTLAAVAPCPARQDAVPARDEVRIMIGRNTFGLVTGVAFFDGHLCIICMRLFA